MQLNYDLGFFLLVFLLVFRFFVLFGFFFNLCRNGTGKSKRNMFVLGRIIFAMKLSKFVVSLHAFEIQRQQLPSIQAADLQKDATCSSLK